MNEYMVHKCTNPNCPIDGMNQDTTAESSATPPQSLRSESGWKEKLKKEYDEKELFYEDIDDFIQTQIIEKLVADLESNPQPGTVWDNSIAHWIELKKQQLKERWLS